MLLKGCCFGAAGGTIGFEATTTLNRIDFGITGNQAVEGGGVMLWDDVEVSIAIEARTQQ
ncbi:MAG: YceI family protein [Gemmatimonadota bacterium]